jgi:hypothetical protein
MSEVFDTSQFVAQYVRCQPTVMLVQHPLPLAQSCGRVQPNTPCGSPFSTDGGSFAHDAASAFHTQYSSIAHVFLPEAVGHVAASPDTQ